MQQKSTMKHTTFLLIVLSTLIARINTLQNGIVVTVEQDCNVVGEGSRKVMAKRFAQCATFVCFTNISTYLYAKYIHLYLLICCVSARTHTTGVQYGVCRQTLNHVRDVY